MCMFVKLYICLIILRMYKQIICNVFSTIVAAFQLYTEIYFIKILATKWPIAQVYKVNEKKYLCTGDTIIMM